MKKGRFDLFSSSSLGDATSGPSLAAADAATRSGSVSSLSFVSTLTPVAAASSARLGDGGLSSRGECGM